jgi:site-specific recombinase XerD
MPEGFGAMQPKYRRRRSNALSIRIREGKGGKEGIALINDQCASTLKRYIEIKPQLEVDGESPLLL